MRSNATPPTCARSPLNVWGDGRPGLVWLSPECEHFSRNQKTITVESVVEFRDRKDGAK